MDKKRMKEMQERMKVLFEFHRIILPRLDIKDQLVIKNIFNKYGIYKVVKWKDLKSKSMKGGNL